MGGARRTGSILHVGWGLRLARVVAILATLAFGWRVSLAYLTPCMHVAAAGPATAVARGDGCCPGADRAAGVDGSAVATGDGSGDRSVVPQVEDHGADGEGGDCSCPIDCSPCCGGAVLHALAAVVPPPLVAVAVLAELPVPEPSTHRSTADPAGILHVPRAA